MLYTNLLHICYIQMGKEIMMFGDIEVEKYKFHQHKSLF